jgi:hypothetical protein
MKRLLLFTLLLCAVSATAFAAPVADGTFRGRTSQGYKTRVFVVDGQVDFVLIPFKARRCTPRTGYVIKFPRFNYQNNKGGGIEMSADGRRFTDGGRVVIGKRGNRAVVDAKISGRFSSDDSKVVGTQRAVVHTNDRYGKHRCVAKIRFSAKR